MAVYTGGERGFMTDTNQQDTKSQDNKRAADMRPVPSQAEGDLETVEEDLARKKLTNDALSNEK
jgi:hypothetical protein